MDADHVLTCEISPWCPGFMQSASLIAYPTRTLIDEDISFPSCDSTNICKYLWLPADGDGRCAHPRHQRNAVWCLGSCEVDVCAVASEQANKCISVKGSKHSRFADLYCRPIAEYGRFYIVRWCSNVTVSHRVYWSLIPMWEPLVNIKLVSRNTDNLSFEGLCRFDNMLLSEAQNFGVLQLLWRVYALSSNQFMAKYSAKHS